ncbi:GvpL/GvpF family gas vesicle protein [Streptomyces sp. NBC_01571]|uniref:GvpL/GvpF family gas vesicle protein n=1 Tax=Streptomyces sp. NBC_01571 TaxID=2975883 RepID=UPI00224CAC94|nr:GvpL/GvpF family gas vesicle protein [Streptomyces sp. NBC_01571]MCX4578482.1 GvpL/GvpF family gas vesicle protein [Streptomyces sp. NBC_01571]
MATDGVYVYAIIRAGNPLPTDTNGVGSPAAPLRTVRQGRVAAVVSEAPPNLRARRRDLLAHQELLLRLSDQGPVLPMRFGMVAPDEELVRGQLAAREAEHLAVLELLDDGVEVNVKAFPAQNALGSLVAEDKHVRRLRDEARRRPGYEANVRLGEAVATALDSRAAEAGRRVLRELTPRARAVATGPEVQGCVLNVSFLVDRADSDGFLDAAEKFAEAHRDRVELRMAGPLPCYSFVSAEGTSVRTAGV